MFSRIAILSLLTLFVLLSGCKDASLAPVVTQETLGFGAFPFLSELRSGEFDLANLGSSAYEMDVYFVDNAGGDDVAQYNLYVSFDDNNPDNGSIGGERMLFRSFRPGDFAPLGEDGNLGLTVRIPFSEVAGFVGAGNAGDVVSGDRFQFTSEVVKADGRVFSADNSTPAVTNAFGGIWNFNVTATCPLDDAAFAGAYSVEYGYVYDEFLLFNQPVQALGNSPLNRTVTLELVPGSTTRRSVDLITYVAPGYNLYSGPTVLTFSCDVVTSAAIDAGTGCGGGNIQATQTGTASFDLNDDASWTIEYSDYGATDGGCGVEAKDFSLVFTKQ